MNSSRSLFLLTAGAFAAGFLTLRFLPGEAAAGRTVAPEKGTLSTESNARGSTASQPRSLAARQAAAKKRAAKLTPAEARAIMEQLLPPVREEEMPWLCEVLGCWARGEPEAATAWLRQWSRHQDVPPAWGLAALPHLARKDFRAALQAERDLLQAGRNTGALLAAAAENDPATIFSWLEKNQPFALHAAGAFAVWLQRDPGAACTWLAGSRFRFQCDLSDLVTNISTIAPEHLQKFLSSVELGGDTSHDVQAALMALELDRDPAAVLAGFPDLTHTQREDLLPPLARYLALRGKPAEITALLGTMRKSERSGFLRHLADEIDGATAEQFLAIFRLPEWSVMEQHWLLESADRLGPEHAAEFMSTLDSTAYHFNNKGSDFWTRNFRQNPEETLPALRRMVDEGKMTTGMLLELTAQLSTDSPASLEKIIAALPEAQRAGPSAILALRNAFAGVNPDLTAYTSLPDAAARQDALHEFVESRQGDYDDAKRAAFVAQLPPALQIEALAVMIETAREESTYFPLVEQAALTMPLSEDLSKVVRTIAAEMPDGAAALRWTDALPPGPARDEGRLTAFHNLSDEDAVAASAWLDAQAQDLPHRDEMVARLTYHIESSDPESAWQWAATIRDEAQRRKAQESILKRLKTRDAESAADE